ncbi:MAG TPA: 50S ribosomal protein L28 [bacterium]|nr:50S ribosomal protein L28 [bacterium]
MPRICAVCGKGRLTGRKVSHSNIKTPKVSRPNLQRIKIVIDGAIRRAQVCTRCIRTGAVQKA